jgi:hypothetical protein
MMAGRLVRRCFTPLLRFGKTRLASDDWRVKLDQENGFVCTAGDLWGQIVSSNLQ